MNWTGHNLTRDVMEDMTSAMEKAIYGKRGSHKRPEKMKEEN